MFKFVVGVPKIRWLGLFQDRKMLVMDLLGRSLEDLFNYCNRIFTLKTVLVVGYELLCRIETIHKKGHLLHRDIKPENFLMGRGRDRHTVYIIDFGLTKLYANPRTSKHIPNKSGYSLTGTARYASINAHLGYGKRNQILSTSLCFLHLSEISLPNCYRTIASGRFVFNRICSYLLSEGSIALARFERGDKYRKISSNIREKTIDHY